MSSYYYGEDDYDYSRRRRSPRPQYDDSHRRSAHHLNPEFGYGGGGGLYRTRSYGQAPQPIVNVYNDLAQDTYTRQDHSPGRTPPYSPSPERRGRRLGDGLVEEMAEMALMDRMRSRSRGRSEATILDRPDFYEWQLAQKEKEIEEANKKLLWEKDAELKKVKEAARKKADAEEAEREQKRLIQDYEEKKRKDAERQKAEEARIKEKMERDKKEAKDEERRIMEKIERDKQEAKDEERRIMEKIEREKKEAKEREEREWKEFLRRQKEKEDKEKAEKKAEEQRLQDAMRRRLEQFGYTQAQIDIMVDEEKTKKYKTEHPQRGPSPGRALAPWKPSSPTYAKIHRDHLSIDTLIYYEVPYEFDRADPDYIIILREMDKYETEVLFEHTRRLRSGKLLLEAPKDKPQYAWYRKRDRSHSRVRKLGILEYKS